MFTNSIHSLGNMHVFEIVYLAVSNYLFIENRGNWTTEGCETEDLENRTVRCRCNHLTNFACLVVCVLVSKYQ